MNNHTFVCDSCGGTFDCEWSDEEAMKESEEIFGKLPKKDLAQICDDCFSEMTAFKENPNEESE